MEKERKQMSATEVPMAFSKDQIVAANQLKTYSLKKLRQDLNEKKYIAVHFGGELEGVILSFDQYEQMAKYIEELEDELEEAQIIKMVTERDPDHMNNWIPYRKGILREEL